MVLVWHDNAGRNHIVDGHQRHALAKRIAEADPTQDPHLLARVLREADGVSDKEARTIAALLEHRGRNWNRCGKSDSRSSRAGEVPPRSELFRQAQGCPTSQTMRSGWR